MGEEEAVGTRLHGKSAVGDMMGGDLCFEVMREGPLMQAKVISRLYPGGGSLPDTTGSELVSFVKNVGRGCFFVCI